MNMEPRGIPDMAKWPHNAKSNDVDPWPAWRSVKDFDWPVQKLRQVRPDACAELVTMNVFKKLTDTIKHAVICFAEGRAYVSGGAKDIILTPERLTSLAELANKAELARASIDAHALFKLMASAIESGDLTGTPLTARDKIDLMKFMANKVLPDSKSQEYTEVAHRVDRGRKVASSLTREELRGMSRDELLGLVDA